MSILEYNLKDKSKNEMVDIYNNIKKDIEMLMYKLKGSPNLLLFDSHFLFKIHYSIHADGTVDTVTWDGVFGRKESMKLIDKIEVLYAGGFDDISEMLLQESAIKYSDLIKYTTREDCSALLEIPDNKLLEDNFNFTLVSSVGICSARQTGSYGVDKQYVTGILELTTENATYAGYETLELEKFLKLLVASAYPIDLLTLFEDEYESQS